MRVYLILMMALCLAACAHKGVGGSYVGDLPQKDATSAIADDAAMYLAEEYAPGHTTLYVLTPEQNANNDFSVSLDTALRGKGFTMSPDGSGAVTVGYTLDALKGENGEQSAWYLQLRLSDGHAVARSYGADGSPEASRSAAPLEKTVLHRATEKISNAAQDAYEGVTENIL